jgi:hypothetical protein
MLSQQQLGVKKQLLLHVCMQESNWLQYCHALLLPGVKLLPLDAMNHRYCVIHLTEQAVKFCFAMQQSAYAQAPAASCSDTVFVPCNGAG